MSGFLEPQFIENLKNCVVNDPRWHKLNKYSNQ